MWMWVSKTSVNRTACSSRIACYAPTSHRLYDRGYLSVDADLRLRVSPQLRDHGWNGVEFYDRETAGYVIPAPSEATHRPNRDALAWHFETRFRAA